MPRRMLILFLIASLLLSACIDDEEDATIPAVTTRATTTTSTTSNSAATADDTDDTAASADSDADSWLVMLYSNGDDEVLEEDVFTDVNEAELVGSSDNVTIVSQLDRYDGAFDGDGDWTGTRRYLIEPDDDLSTINSTMLEDMGEVNMADGQSLVDFVTWAIDAYPADRYALIMSDHGMGWPGGWIDPDPAEPGPDGLELTEDGDMLLLNEMSDALADIQQQTGVERLDLVGFDACLMAQLEVASAVAPYARYMVASEEVEPSLGWAYASFLQQLVDDPTLDGAGLSKAIVDSYIDKDTRITDEDARAKLIEENYDGEPSVRELIADFSQDTTLSAYDLSQLPGVISALDEVVVAMADIDQDKVAEARTYAQSFEDVFGEDPSYIDLVHFVDVVADESDDSAVADANQQLQDALSSFVIAERHGDERKGANGVAIYFPDSGLYESSMAGEEAYDTVASQFTTESQWDDFLRSHYYDIPFGSDKEEGQAVSAPGADEITISDIRLSEDRINVADSTTLSAEVSGNKIGFIYTFTGYYNEEDDSIWVADMDFIDAGQSRQTGGIYYPDWGKDDEIEIEFEWEPILYGINDGDGVSLALVRPEDYGDTNEAATYSVEGKYHFAKGGTRYAKLYFKEGELVKAVSFTGENGSGSPRTFTPRAGDSFTILHDVILVHSDTDQEVEYVQQEGDTLEITDAGLSVEEVTAPTGDYVVGLQATDLDGNLFESYNTLTVDE